jgi:uncharacterized membrane protein HdeD (DUF308 family)
MAIDVLKEYLQEYSGNIMILSGILLLVVGLLYVETFGSLVSVVAFFFGIVLFTFGFFARIGLFSLKLSSLNGLGTVLICVSVMLFALSFSLIEFEAVASITYMPEMVGGELIYIPQVNTYRPYAWLSFISIEVGLPIFFVALIAKVFSARR